MFCWSCGLLSSAAKESLVVVDKREFVRFKRLFPKSLVASMILIRDPTIIKSCTRLAFSCVERDASAWIAVISLLNRFSSKRQSSGVHGLITDSGAMMIGEDAGRVRVGSDSVGGEMLILITPSTCSPSPIIDALVGRGPISTIPQRPFGNISYFFFFSVKSRLNQGDQLKRSPCQFKVIVQLKSRPLLIVTFQINAFLTVD